MSLNIFEIWNAIGRQTPFAVRRDHWSEGQYAVVEKIEIEKWPYGKAYGYPIEEGKHSDRFEYDVNWRATNIIPSSGTYQWSLAENVDINKGKTIAIKRKRSTAVAYSIHTIFNFGKHKGKTVEAAFRLEPSYILWAAVHADNFCLTAETFEALEKTNPNFKFSAEVQKINDQKLKYLQSLR
ncbi:MAG: hypothetical protein E6Q24_21260 [Chitinophagaceae bacterium]|nr:MAG: hypothetical protein E6Q24_21260 [Chitinophagaceae bacterium]